MGYVIGTDSRQMTLGVWSIEDEVPQDSPARFIEVFVDSLDLEAMGFEHTVPAPTGRPPYNPYDLVKLYVWGYLNRIRSSRRLMRECRRNIELWFLLNRLCPDFRTIADLRKAHRKLLKKIFLIFARACKEMKLMDAETLCLDGTTVRAVNGRKQSTSAELSRKKLEYARAQLEAVEKYLDSMVWRSISIPWTRTISVKAGLTIPSPWIWTRITCPAWKRSGNESPSTKNA